VSDIETNGVTVFGDPIANAVEQMTTLIQPSADKCALMADHHLGYSMPIGGVAAYRNHVSPSGVGFDIACGNKAVCLDVNAEHVRASIGEIMDEIWSSVSFGMGRKNAESVSHPVLEDSADSAWSLVRDVSQGTKGNRASLYDIACDQLGTVGGGNHYVDIFIDERDRVWVGCHFGSRGLGHKIATWFVKQGGGRDGINAPPVLLSMDSELGQNYFKAMTLAGKYAYAGRDWVCGKVASIIGGGIVDEVHNHHNFTWIEEHDGEQFYVVRKGATPAWPGQRGFVGGSMAEQAVIIEGVEHAESVGAMYSTVHGAGRAMSRTEAKGKINRKTGEVKTVGAVTSDMMREWVEMSGVELRGGGVDESPHCYKRLDDVLGYHSNTIRILHHLTPIGVAMAGADEFDPYKD